MKAILKFSLGMGMSCFINFTSFCQHNLVPNYSFEDSVICPVFNDPLPKPWYMPSNYNTSYYFNSCSISNIFSVPYNINNFYTNYQYSKSGHGYAAIASVIIDMQPDARSYLQIRLKDSLMASHCYYVEFWVNLLNSANYATNNVALWFSKTAKYADTINNPYGLLPGNLNPQVYNYGNPVIYDTVNWIKVSSIYVAQGGEQFITIGNFKNDNATIKRVVNNLQNENSSYYYVDDVSVIPLDSLPLKADAGLDTTITSGDSVFIGSLTNGIPNISWYNMVGNVIDTGRPGFFVHPPTTTSYIIEQTVCGYYSRDTVTVSVNAMPLHWLSVEAFPLSTPWRGAGVRWQTANEQNVSHYSIQRSYRGTNDFENVGQVVANNKPYNEYSYVDELTRNEKQETVLYRLQSIDKDGQRSYSPIRRVTFNTQQPLLSIYPNPTTGLINIISNKLKQVHIVDVTGRIATEQNFSTTNHAQLDVRQLAKGAYLLKVTSLDNLTKTTKLIVK